MPDATPPEVTRWLSEQHRTIEEHAKLQEAHRRLGADLQLAQQRASDYERQNQQLLARLERVTRMDEALRTRLADINEAVHAALEESRRSAAQLGVLPSVSPAQLDELDVGIRKIAAKFAPAKVETTFAYALHTLVGERLQKDDVALTEIIDALEKELSWAKGEMRLVGAQ